jgi:hypothetical protein
VELGRADEPGVGGRHRLALLAWLGYVPGSSGGLPALSAAYALLPCALKLLAALLLWRAPCNIYSGEKMPCAS